MAIKQDRKHKQSERHFTDLDRHHPVGNESVKTVCKLRLGDFLKELELTEGKATGIPLIRKALKDNDSPDPVFRSDDARSFFRWSFLFIRRLKMTKEKARMLTLR